MFLKFIFIHFVELMNCNDLECFSFISRYFQLYNVTSLLQNNSYFRFICAV